MNNDIPHDDGKELHMKTKAHLDEILSTFITERSPVFNELVILRDKGWKNPAGDKYFTKQRQVADHADGRTKIAFFKMMQQIGHEMNSEVGITSRISTTDPVNILDLCLAPGGFAQYFAEVLPSSKISGFSLPVSSGGHEMMHDLQEDRLKITFQDITMMMDEILGETDSRSELLKDHPDAKHLQAQWPYGTKRFDLIICDGQVLRTHQRAEYREYNEAARLILSQLIIALRRLASGGTLIVLLHKVDAFNNFQLLALLDKFSDIQLFKPTKRHAIRSSFYLVAQNVQTGSQVAAAAVAKWSQRWKEATFSLPTDENDSEAEVLANLADFGETYIRLGDPIWSIQKVALEKSSFCRK